jgi:ribosome-associated translation inhibitor RaiA
MSTGMRIDVHDPGSHFDDQTRAYAEYRVFSILANLADVVQRVGVDLARTADAAETSTVRDAFACSVSIRLRSGLEVDVASYGQHPYEAIDRAARQVATVVSSMTKRHTAQPMPSIARL